MFIERKLQKILLAEKQIDLYRIVDSPLSCVDSSLCGINQQLNFLLNPDNQSPSQFRFEGTKSLRRRTGCSTPKVGWPIPIVRFTVP